MQPTEFLESEGADTTNKESLDRNNASMKGTLRTVKKLTRLMKHSGKAERGTLSQMFENRFGSEFIEKTMQDETTESWDNESLSSSSSDSGDQLSEQRRKAAR